MDVFDLIIVGAGPAGTSAAIYAERKKINTFVITKDFLGQISRSYKVENYLGFKKIKGIELAKRFKNHLEKIKVKTKIAKIKKINKKKRFFYSHY